MLKYEQIRELLKDGLTMDDIKTISEIVEPEKVEVPVVEPEEKESPVIKELQDLKKVIQSTNLKGAELPEQKEVTELDVVNNILGGK